MRDRTAADDTVQGAYNRALLDLILPPMRMTAKEAGYAICVHGSLNRDIDLVAIPWREHNVSDKDELVKRITFAVAGVIGRCNFERDWAVKPHGRFAKILLAWCGENTAQIDLSVMPALATDKDQ
ncbi:hypothetical protein GO308_12925 [Sphingomonas sp. SFZ2018-12]|uniref:hypothetical protein n=1 Tax=Sphingomonas sp. SFZ2018-12 TaxID=2683197 RepID=UPI001F0DFB42|nr:hypothetical protein [Sphingomonas sp. SFZ2018-12]MCH4894019.1 hypothetical protein [Sphingomonas sp. SFZ2018-12]